MKSILQENNVIKALSIGLSAFMGMSNSNSVDKLNDKQDLEYTLPSAMEIINMAVKLIKVQAGEVNEHANKAGEEADRACELANAIEIAQSREYKNRKLAKIEKVKSRIEAAAANTAYKFALESHSEAQMALVIAEQIRDIALERDSEIEDVQILEEVKAEYKKALEYKEKSADNVERARIYAQKATMLSERNFKYIVASQPIAEEKVTEQRICVEQ